MTDFNAGEQRPDKQSKPLVTILGPTATGKTALAVKLANSFSGEIISADSRQVYRSMDIGTGKDLHEYGDTPYHLIDIVDPGFEYNLFEFVGDFNQAFEAINHRNKLPFLVGGTGMYLDAILNRYRLTAAGNHPELEELDNETLKQKLLSLRPKQHNTTDLTDRKRLIAALSLAMSENSNEQTIQAPAVASLTIGLQFPRAVTRQRITARLKQRLNEGLIEEVEQLKNKHEMTWSQIEFYGLEYRYVAHFLQGKLNRNDMFQKLNSAIHQFAKQQEKWFRNIAKKGQDIHWLNMEGDLFSQASESIQLFLKQ